MRFSHCKVRASNRVRQRKVRITRIMPPIDQKTAVFDEAAITFESLASKIRILLFHFGKEKSKMGLLGESVGLTFPRSGSRYLEKNKACRLNSTLYK